jgi:hypothetical protein
VISVRVTGHVERFLLCFPFLALTKETNKKRQNLKEKSVTVLFALAKEPSPFTPLVCSSLNDCCRPQCCMFCVFFSFYPVCLSFRTLVRALESIRSVLTRFQSFPVFNTVLFTAEGCVGGGRSGVSPVVKGKDNRFLFFSFLCPLHVSPRLFVRTSFFSPAFKSKSFLVTRLWSCRFPMQSGRRIVQLPIVCKTDSDVFLSPSAREIFVHEPPSIYEGRRTGQAW